MKTFVKVIILCIFIVGILFYKTKNDELITHNLNKETKEENKEEIVDEFELYLNKAINIMKEEKEKTLNSSKYLEVFNTKNMSWCTEFVVWSLLEADKQLNTNYVNNIYPLLDTGAKASNWFKKNNRLHLEKDYIPKRGDFMFFKYYEKIVDHTAFVIDVKEIDGITYVYTIEGNIPSLKDKSIKERILPIDDKYIYGYGSFN